MNFISKMKKTLLLTLLSLLLLAGCARNMKPYDIVWNSPSGNASGSMPIGNGEVGANIWVEQNGDIVFYISRTDSWSETGELFKLGRIRVHITPSVVEGNDFVQALNPGKGCIRISGNGTTLNFFIDSDSDVIYLTGKSGHPVDVVTSAEVWRDREFVITPEIASRQYRSISGFAEGQATFKGYPDHIVSGDSDITVFHHNCESSYEATLQLEGLEPQNRASHDPFIDRCFGFRITMDGAEKVSDVELKAAATSSIDIKIATLTGKFEGGKGWKECVTALSESAPSAKTAMCRTAKYWKKFWNKSYIEVQTPDGVTGERINTAYVLQSWIQACACRGHYPIKFNGTIFTIDPKFTDEEQDFGPDYRRWGGDFWWQNTRLPYHPMLKSGDFDMMKPLFEHYFGNLEMMKANARALCGAEGALSPETQTVFGTFCPNDFYWNRENAEDNMPLNPYIKYHWDSSVEMVSLMLDYWDYTCDREFVKTRLVPYAKEMLTFYDTFYHRDENGRLRITPTQSLETYWYDVINDMATVAGLKETTARLMKLPSEISLDDDKALWKRLADCLPDIPVGIVDGKELFLPAEKYKDQRTNCENPDLYPIFPFHLCNISTENLQTGINTFENRIEKRDNGWTQDGQQAARLGLTEDAKAILIGKLDYADEHFRFPVYWGPNFDWTPDQDHGSNILITLQEMVLQTYDGIDYILPAFPADWGVKYKLYSFGGKVVKGSRKMPTAF